MFPNTSDPRRKGDDYATPYLRLRSIWVKKKDEYGWDDPEVRRFLGEVSQTHSQVEPFPFEETIRPGSSIVTLDSPLPKKKKSVTRLKAIGRDDSVDGESENEEIKALLEGGKALFSSQVEKVPLTLGLNYDKDGTIVIDDDDDDEFDLEGLSSLSPVSSAKENSENDIDTFNSNMFNQNHELFDTNASICEEEEEEEEEEGGGRESDDDDDDDKKEGDEESITSRTWKAIHRRRSRYSFLPGEGPSFSIPVPKDDISTESLVEGKTTREEGESASSEGSYSSSYSSESDDEDDEDDSFIVSDDAPLEYYDDDDMYKSVRIVPNEEEEKEEEAEEVENAFEDANNDNNNDDDDDEIQLKTEDQELEINGDKKKKTKKKKTIKKTKSKRNKKQHIISFKKEREDIAKCLLNECNKVIFDNKFKKDEISVGWTNTLRTTSGTCKYVGSLSDGTARAEIMISTKVCDRYKRLKSTLVHEMCHAAVYLIDREPQARSHGRLFKKWGRIAMEKYGVRVETTHNYAIHYKHLYECPMCGKKYGVNVLYDEPTCPVCCVKVTPIVKHK